MKYSIFLPIALALAACSGGGSEGRDVAEGTAEAADLGLPEGFSAMPGMEVTNDAEITAADGTEVRMVTLKSGDSPSAVIAHYRAEAEAAGYTIGMDSDDGTMAQLTSTKEGARSFDMLASDMMGATEVVLTIGPEA